MATPDVHDSASDVWALVRSQHGVVSHEQLTACGLTRAAIKHRIRCGKLIRVHRGIYVVGRAELSPYGRWMAAVLRCGAGALLSHASAASLWGIAALAGPIEVSVQADRRPRAQGIRIHRRSRVPEADRTEHHGIPVTGPVLTLIDLAGRLPERRLEAAVNAADKLGLVDPVTLREAVASRAGQTGRPSLVRLLDAHKFARTDSELERRFLVLVRRAGLQSPETGVTVCGYRADFFWPRLGLIVETDGLRYHRTAASQARDRRRDQVHAAAGYTTLRFTHAQVRYRPQEVIQTLSAVISRLTGAQTLNG